jgi:hypothetical protein
MKYILILFILIHQFTKAQRPTFDEVAPVIFKNCLPCHSKEGAGPFPLENYDQVKDHAKLISYTIQKRLMPPWKADINYTRFMRERVLPDSDITLISLWVANGAPNGVNSNIFRESKELLPETTLGRPDVIIKVHKPHKIKANNEDEFVTYVEDLNLGTDRYLKAIQIIPGNKKALHHCRIDLDTTNSYMSLINNEGFINTWNLDSLKPTLSFVDDYVPGISAYQYPDSVGMKIYKKMHVLFNLHYSPSLREQTDQTSVYFYFYPKNTVVRPVHHDYLSSVEFSQIRDLTAKKGELTTTEMQTEPFSEDFSLFAIQPHMHLIGKYFNVFAITPVGDTIPLIRINDWDFNWQENYYFPNFIKIPKGTFFKAVATYDNTSNNPNNPFNPPRDIRFNFDMKTTNEMFEFYTQDVDYIAGDEKRILYPQKGIK